ncbi:heterokaryon incompatibility protein-domain-containing protein [Cladorrhinum sp. PSN332]|nr:heterokaryon incompatibility protein-domain-containing protein [Cladorrhinum sp. PSN332]
MNTTNYDALYAGVPIAAARREIRVLTLHPGGWDSPVQCDLSTLAFERGPQYKALSYTWGTDPLNFDVNVNGIKITVNGIPFRVRKNLYAILQRLRRDDAGSKLVLWIDAICINQSDDDEKTSQVQLMALIYAHCREVLVWLGDCYKDRRHSLRYVSRHGDNKALLREYANDFKQEAEGLDYCFHLACFFLLLKDAGSHVDFAHYDLPPFWAPSRTHRLSRYDIPVPTDEFKSCYAERLYYVLRHVSESTWTSRGWTLQEFAVSPRVTICFGTTAVPLEVFSTVTAAETDAEGKQGHEYWSARMSVRLGSIRAAFHLHHTLRNVAATFRPWVKVSRVSKTVSAVFTPSLSWLTRSMLRRTPKTVFEYCASFKDMETTKAADKVFIIMSFMSFLGMNLPMQINYDHSVRFIYTRVCSDQIRNCNGNPEAYEPLAPLRFSRDKNKHIDLPSWVVDWTSFPWHDNHIIPGWARPSKLTPEPAISEDDVLTVTGWEIGTVCEVANLAHGARAWELARTWPERDETNRSLLLDRREMVLRTLCGDMLDSPVDWPRLVSFWVEMTAAFQAAGRFLYRETTEGRRTGSISFVEASTQVAGMIQGIYGGPHAAASESFDVATTKGITELLHWAAIMSKGNCLFVTDSGHIGLGGKNIAVKDRVFVLYQGRTPFVLRSSSAPRPQFRVVSECYVDGLMYGEVAKTEANQQRIAIE